MVRKMLERRSCEDGSVSSFTSSLSSRSRFSLLSTRNSLIKSSIAPPYLKSPELGESEKCMSCLDSSQRTIRLHLGRIPIDTISLKSHAVHRPIGVFALAGILDALQVLLRGVPPPF